VMRTDFVSIYGKRLHFNNLNAELNPICHLLALLCAHHILHVSRVRVKVLFIIFMLLITPTVAMFETEVDNYEKITNVSTIDPPFSTKKLDHSALFLSQQVQWLCLWLQDNNLLWIFIEWASGS